MGMKKSCRDIGVLFSDETKPESIVRPQIFISYHNISRPVSSALLPSFRPIRCSAIFRTSWKKIKYRQSDNKTTLTERMTPDIV